MPSKRRIVIVDDHTLFRDGLRTILETEEDLEVVADAESAEDIVELVWQTRPDVLLLDIRMPQGSGLDAVPAVLKISPNTQVLVLTASDEKEEHVRAFRLGAKGVILKDSARQTLMQAIRTVCRRRGLDGPAHGGALAEELSHMGEGEPISTRQENGLTERELEIVRLVASGYKNKEVGATLAISERTVKTHLTNIFQKLGVRDRVGLVMYAAPQPGRRLTATGLHPGVARPSALMAQAGRDARTTGRTPSPAVGDDGHGAASVGAQVDTKPRGAITRLDLRRWQSVAVVRRRPTSPRRAARRRVEERRPCSRFDCHGVGPSGSAAAEASGMRPASRDSAARLDVAREQHADAAERRRSVSEPVVQRQACRHPAGEVQDTSHLRDVARSGRAPACRMRMRRPGLAPAASRRRQAHAMPAPPSRSTRTRAGASRARPGRQSAGSDRDARASCTSASTLHDLPRAQERRDDRPRRCRSRCRESRRRRRRRRGRQEARRPRHRPARRRGTCTRSVVSRQSRRRPPARRRRARPAQRDAGEARGGQPSDAQATEADAIDEAELGDARAAARRWRTSASRRAPSHECSSDGKHRQSARRHEPGEPGAGASGARTSAAPGADSRRADATKSGTTSGFAITR